ncbi:MAG: sulfur reduction protein DsrE [Betaproteobacteria bacterium]|nr:sulfur reduction protein DsrE [Betaproteobacteria bacterium]
MARYLFIESRDPYDSADSPHFLEMVKGVGMRNGGATLFLVQNGVLAARDGALHSERYGDLARSGVNVLADSFSLRERAIGTVADGVRQAEIDNLVDLLMEPGTKAVWH